MPSLSDYVSHLAAISSAAKTAGADVAAAHGIIRSAQSSAIVHQATLGALSDSARAMGATVSSQLERTSEALQNHGEKIRGKLDQISDESTRRLGDLIFDLETEAGKGNAWAESLLDIVHQVEQGTIDASAAINSMGDGVILFDGQLRSVRDVLLEVLPTTGQVQTAIKDAAAALKSADIETLVQKLRGQYNSYAQLLADTVEAFKAGRVSLERVLEVARQIQENLPQGETSELAALIERYLQQHGG